MSKASRHVTEDATQDWIKTLNIRIEVKHINHSKGSQKKFN